MNPLAFRVLNAPVRSLAFAIFGIISLIKAADTVGRLLGPAFAGVFWFVALLVFAATLTYGAWFPREHHGQQAPLLRHLGAAHTCFGLIAAVCVLAAFAPEGGFAAALAFGLSALSLARTHDESVPMLVEREAVLRDSVVALVH